MTDLFYLTDGREELYQWDTNRYIHADGVQQVHFVQSNVQFDVNVENKKALIPNEFLQNPCPIRAYAYILVDGNYTLRDKVLKIIPRAKPTDYPYPGLDHEALANRDKADQHPISAITGLSDALAEKVDKETGKGLSTNDFTTAEKTKLAGLSNYDDTAVKQRLSTIEGKESGWDAKQDAITDLSTIRSGAALGATALQPNDPISDLAEDANHRTVTDTEKATWNAKQNALTPDVDYATPEAVQQDISDATTDMATETWVSEQGFITADDIPVLSVNGKTGVVVLTAADLGIGSVFDLKGSVATKTALPTTGNKKGDVWYVVDESVGYIWLNDGTVDRWEMLGLSIDLSNYVTTSALASALNGYVQKVTGKGLSTNDFTDAYKTKLDAAITSLAGYATEQWVEAKGYLTEHQSLSAYRTSAAQDTIDATKEAKGKMTLNGTERTVTAHTLSITDGGTTTTYTVLGV